MLNWPARAGVRAAQLHAEHRCAEPAAVRRRAGAALVVAAPPPFCASCCSDGRSAGADVDACAPCRRGTRRGGATSPACDLGDFAGHFGVGLSPAWPLTADHHVAGLHARPSAAGPPGTHVGHQRALAAAEAPGARPGRRVSVLDGRADVAAGDLAAGDQLLGDALGDVGREWRSRCRPSRRRARRSRC